MGLKRKSKKKVAAILNAATEIRGMDRIAKAAEAGSDTVMEVLRDFPLWDFVRKQLKDGRK